MSPASFYATVWGSAFSETTEQPLESPTRSPPLLLSIYLGKPKSYEPSPCVGWYPDQQLTVPFVLCTLWLVAENPFGKNKKRKSEKVNVEFTVDDGRARPGPPTKHVAELKARAKEHGATYTPVRHTALSQVGL